MKVYHAKDVFSDVLYEMLKSATLERITVKQVCEQSGLSKKAFYYNFIDKYDLGVYAFNQRMTSTLADFGVVNYREQMLNGTLLPQSYEGQVAYVTRVGEFWINNKHLYHNLLLCRGQNCLYEDWHDAMIAMFSIMLRRQCTGRDIAPSLIRYVASMQFYATETAYEWWVQEYTGALPCGEAERFIAIHNGIQRLILAENVFEVGGKIV